MEPFKGKTLYVGVKRRGHYAKLFKPHFAAKEDYWIGKKDGHLSIFIGKTIGFPIHMEFQSNKPVRAIGFANPGVRAHDHHSHGHCGGCFSLVDSIPGGGSLSVLVRNDGIENVTPRVLSPLYFDFTIFFEGKKGLDPRIYNQGDPDMGHPWWKKPWRWLTGWQRLRTVS